MKSIATTVPDYLAELPEDRRAALATIRDMIRTAAPDAVEDMQYGMASYAQGALLFALASQKHHMSLYICDSEAVDAHRQQLGTLNCGKGCIRFKSLDQLPLDVVSDILCAATRRREAWSARA